MRGFFRLPFALAGVCLFLDLVILVALTSNSASPNLLAVLGVGGLSAFVTGWALVETLVARPLRQLEEYAATFVATGEVPIDSPGAGTPEAVRWLPFHLKLAAMHWTRPEVEASMRLLQRAIEELRRLDDSSTPTRNTFRATDAEARAALLAVLDQQTSIILELIRRPAGDPA